MNPLRFSFVLHIHQPVGNFDHVFREHADDVYTPFLDFLEERGLWPIGLHVSGPLLEWLGENDAALHDRIGRLATDGRIELLSAGWYEPILAALPRVDRAEQLGWMREELVARFGVAPTGLWLTERVWEPDLPADFADAGIEYVLIDDHLAIRAGVTSADLQRPLRAEANGQSVDLLTIDERLRYLIPFRPADEIAEELRGRWARGDQLALIGDDGEKFGGWPRTKEWLYDGGWLESFGDRMDELRADGVVRCVTPAQARVEIESTGPVYLPTGSYPEMEGWALGGHWKGFLARYPEANRMHRRMLALSAESRERGDPPEVRRAIGRSQCNDAYWHGVFGGLYMKHLREGVRGQLMEAETVLRAGRPLECVRQDLDGDGVDEWWVRGADVSAWVAADSTVTDLLWLKSRTDVLDVLTRYREQYHHDALRRTTDAPARGEGEPDSGSAAASIHDIEEAAVLETLPPMDLETRVLVRERVLAEDATLEAYRDATYEAVWVGSTFRPDAPPEEQGAGPDAPEEKQGAGPDAPAVVRGAGSAQGAGPEALVWTFRTHSGPRVEKVLTVYADGTVDHEWSWEPDAFPQGSFFAPEFSLGVSVTVDTAPQTERWTYPIVTTSKCPDGFEEIVQGESITPRWPVSHGRARMTIRPSE